MPRLIVQMSAIRKSFGGSEVLKGIDFALEKGTIHALLGENGSGKSTLMNILSGVLACDSGEIFFEGNRLANHNGMKLHPEISFIHQELALINDLDITENIFLGCEIKKGLLVDKKSMRAKTLEILQQIGADLSPDTLVKDLDASSKQIIEIAKAMRKNAKVIIMDEPTASLTNAEIPRVFDIMRSVKNRGISLIFISHKLNEVLKICDAYTIIKDGILVTTGAVTPELTEQDLTRHMVGKDLNYEGLYRERQVQEIILELKGLNHDKYFQNINLKIQRGEIVGVTGLIGDGRSEALSTVYGGLKSYRGSVLFCGKEVHIRSAAHARKYGITYVPPNRKERGIIKDLSISENMTLPILKQLKSHLLISTKKREAVCDKYINRLRIKVGRKENLIGSLSGGNQQKVVFAKALASDPRLVILENPTQGVDVGAKMEIYQLILSLAEEGISFVVLSSEAPEIMSICDRIYVMNKGEIKQEFTREEATEEKIMVLAAGGVLQ